MTYITRFRAYQLDSAGSLFSYYKEGQFTLVEARLPKGGIEVLEEELAICGVDQINVLHITSWDTDHMRFLELTQILNKFRPDLIEVPSYEPESEEGKRNKRVLEGYDEIHSKYVKNVRYCTQSWFKGLSVAAAKGTNHVVCPSEFEGDCKNDMSLIKLFRSGGFNVSSFGDCESREISDRLGRSSIFTSELDVMILAHHGANNGFTNEEFLKRTNPILAVCNSNYDNQYEHPKQEIRDILFKLKIPVFTTKTGDIIIYQQIGSSRAEVFNLISDNLKLSSKGTFTPKRFKP
ncbi:hypothetical protein [Algoriphagus zhangzhouensis]|uniref:Competence protein ComEC n=1 Tax=Algoriphagus zhangzhouensis TaxID=1073327 RepID=A0A1M7Z4Y5_9BACT|nr:hypothetical protein [Algoriphagus zhangzhouensis]TDY48771.1 competence protein ComEC [Algoriphagus zhangzhouensis]SHO59929.1 competence protein ComEC [Algoriphagus zhangzhouensis]